MAHQKYGRLRAGALLMVLCWTTAGAAAGENLLANGSFDHPDDPLYGWKRMYKDPGESHYDENYEYVSVERMVQGRTGVLHLNVATQYLADNPGVKVDSHPIPFEPGTYRFSARARSTGPNCRILIEGYKWRPGVRPHDQPQMGVLRKCYKFKQLYFGSLQGGDFGGASASWKKAEQIFPDGNLSPLGERTFNEIDFLVVHIVGIGGKAGSLYVDDVQLERVK